MGARMLRRIALVPLLALAPAASASAHLRPAPNVCASPDSSCLTKGRGGNVSVSPTIVRVGGVLTIKLDSTADYGGVADWSISSRPVGTFSSAPGLKLLGCKGKTVKKKGGPNYVGHGLAGTAFCRYRVLSAGRGWQAAVANFSVRYGGLASYNEEAWRAASDGSYIEGHVRGLPRTPGAMGPPLNGVRVKAAGRDGDSTTTNNEGYYVLQIGKEGSYDVTPVKRPSDRRRRPQPNFTPAFRRIQVGPDRVFDVNFRLNRGDDIAISFLDANGKEISGISADGVSSATALIEATDANDRPITSSNGPLDLFVDGGRLTSKAIVCGPSNDRIWPGGSGTAPGLVDLNADHGATTPNANGELMLGIFAGTEAGSLSITARLPGASAADPGRTATLALTAVSSGDSLAQATSLAKTGGSSVGQPFPFANPSDPSGELSWFQAEMDYLAAAKTVGYFKGWEYQPLATTTGATSYGIYFYRNGQPSSGGVLETDKHGFQPLLDGSPLPSVSTWAAGRSYTLQLRRGAGASGETLFYLGWPYENTPADRCIRTGPA